MPISQVDSQYKIYLLIYTIDSSKEYYDAQPITCFMLSMVVTMVFRLHVYEYVNLPVCSTRCTKIYARLYRMSCKDHLTKKDHLNNWTYLGPNMWGRGEEGEINHTSKRFNIEHFCE